MPLNDSLSLTAVTSNGHMFTQQVKSPYDTDEPVNCNLVIADSII